MMRLDDGPAGRKRLAKVRRRAFGSASSSVVSDTLQSIPDAAPPPPLSKPARDVVAGATARAASQATIHPLDTLKVRMQTRSMRKSGRMPTTGGCCGGAKKGTVDVIATATGAARSVGGLYRGVLGAASGAGIAIGAYFGFYSVARNLIARESDLPPGGVAFVSGAVAAASSSVVKVPLAVCIRSVQAGIYSNVFTAAESIVRVAGLQGLFAGYVPTLIEDVPDMAFKFAAYESARSLHRAMFKNRNPTPQEDFMMGAFAGAFAAGATTPLDVIKTTMMCTAASRPTMISAARAVVAREGVKGFFRGLGPRAVSNGINSAVFFTFFEAIQSIMAKKRAHAIQKAVIK